MQEVKRWINNLATLFCKGKRKGKEEARMGIGIGSGGERRRFEDTRISCVERLDVFIIIEIRERIIYSVIK